MPTTLTLADIRGQVRQYIDEPAANYWTDAELNSYIASRQLDLWKKILAIASDYFMGDFTMNLSAGKFLYGAAEGVPANFWRVLSMRVTTPGFTDVVFRNGDPNAPGFLDGLRADQPVSNPDAFLYGVRGNGFIVISPIPQQVYATNVVYVQQPTAVVNDTDTFLIPDEFIDYIGYMAAADALLKGPVGAPDVWEKKANDCWRDTMLALDSPRSLQDPMIVRSFGGGDDAGGDW